MKNELTVCIQKTRHSGLNIFIDEFTAGQQKNLLAQPLTFVETELYACCEAPTFSLSETGAQHLMDQLWACGVRPIEEVGTTKQVEAIQAHLADMKKLVFNYDTKIKKGTQ